MLKALRGEEMTDLKRVRVFSRLKIMVMKRKSPSISRKDPSLRLFRRLPHVPIREPKMSTKFPETVYLGWSHAGRWKMNEYSNSSK
jgi:hypothetical protein